MIQPMRQQSDYHIPIREASAPDGQWHSCHDFFNGFGYYNSGADGSSTRHVWCNDVSRLLGDDRLKDASDAALEALYAELAPLLAAEAERQRLYLEAHPVVFSKFTIPLIKNPIPDIRKALDYD